LAKSSKIAVAGMNTPTLFLVLLFSVEQENTEIGMQKQDQLSIKKNLFKYFLNYIDMVPVAPLLLISLFYNRHEVYYHFKVYIRGLEL